MNIQIADPMHKVQKMGRDGWLLYREGHKDARHAAAELSLIADELLDALISLQTAAYNIGGEHVTEYRELILSADDADNVIAKARGQQ
jgi:hypothetical protein